VFSVVNILEYTLLMIVVCRLVALQPNSICVVLPLCSGGLTTCQCSKVPHRTVLVALQPISLYTELLLTLLH